MNQTLFFLLEKKDPNTPFYVGSLLMAHMEQGFMSGGAGYTLSRYVGSLLMAHMEQGFMSRGTG